MLGKPVSAHVTISFPEQGQITGQAPCNRYFAAQEAPLPWFKTGPIASTKMACPDLEIESLYFQTLSRVTLAEVQGDDLILSDGDGALLVYKH